MRGRMQGVRQPLPTTFSIEQAAAAAQYAAMLAAQRFAPSGVSADDWLYLALMLYGEFAWSLTSVLARLALPRSSATTKPVQQPSAVGEDCIVAGMLYGALHAVQRFEPSKLSVANWGEPAAKLFDKMSWPRPDVLSPYPTVAGTRKAASLLVVGADDGYPPANLPPGTLPKPDDLSYGQAFSVAMYIALVCQDRQQPGDLTLSDFRNAARLVYLNFGWKRPLTLE